jgi:hypothetical protein
VIADGDLVAMFFADGARAVVHPAPDASQTAEQRVLGASAIVAWMRRRALRIIGHDSVDAPLNQSCMAPALRDAGLVPSGPGFRM